MGLFRCRIVDPYSAVADFDAIGLNVCHLGVLGALEVYETEPAGTTGLRVDHYSCFLQWSELGKHVEQLGFGGINAQIEDRQNGLAFVVLCRTVM